MTDDNNILDKVGRSDGMTVPDGYFADFVTMMEKKLPVQDFEREESNVLPSSWWQKARPYIYMAAMFCGIWLMMWIFADISDRSSNAMTDNAIVAEALGSDQFYDYYYPVDEINEYDLMEDMYEDGVTLTNFNFEE